MGFEAELESFPLTQLVQMVAAGKKTGVATIQRERVCAKIVFRAGRIVLATSASHERLGATLIRKGLLSADELTAALAAQKESGVHRPLGTILVERGAVDSKVLESETRAHVEAILQGLLRWERGQFSFRSAAVEENLLILKDGVVTEGILLNAVGAESRELEPDPALDEELLSFLS